MENDGVVGVYIRKRQREGGGGSERAGERWMVNVLAVVLTMAILAVLMEVILSIYGNYPFSVSTKSGRITLTLFEGSFNDNFHDFIQQN